MWLDVPLEVALIASGGAIGYTVLDVDYNIRVKASDVFRNNFAGKINRQNTEAALGVWPQASTSVYEADQRGAQHSDQRDTRNSAPREERKAQRHAERSSLMADYNQHRKAANFSIRSTRLPLGSSLYVGGKSEMSENHATPGCSTRNCKW